MSALAFSLALLASSPTDAVAATDAGLRPYLICAAPQREAQMHQLLDTRSDSDYGRAANAVFDQDHCARRERQPLSYFMAALSPLRGKVRGLVAEVLISRLAAQTPLAVSVPQKSYTAGWFALTGRPRPVDEMATCVAAIDPAGIQRLLAARPASQGQRDALNGLQSSLGACLARGYQLNSDVPALRAALAEALYHRLFPVSGGVS